ncbi:MULTISPECIES: hypothetical protein [unclassified Bradyrhizobium]|uniref:hypothetical protein n=1 Tax=unclassified Bradyrhizobium TaxID=2631580 RepID=UPI00291671AA|nr:MULTISPECIES: hypothetical protein [unclassified Bradyrhizobium]
MARPSSLQKAKQAILNRFSETLQKIYSETEIADLLRENRQAWKLAQDTKLEDFLSFLERNGLKRYELRSERYNRRIARYCWSETSLYRVALSINRRAYLCHATALSLHDLIDIKKQPIYLNIEQSAKTSTGSSLTQIGIDRAFSGKQRCSNLVYTCNSSSIVIVAGKHTNRLGVTEVISQTSETIQVTDLERTLIDIVVRPAYAGGPSQVLKAYSAARDRVSIEHLIAVLKQLAYIYPYHQSIGFLMERAGYAKAHLAQLRAIGLNHDFYLAHRLQQPVYSKDWRLFYPSDIG